jgi:GNAT superfamily N-acetyltransferase
VNGVVIRRCRRGDLRALEWDGVFRDAAPLFTRMFELAEHGAMVMLVATCRGEHVGQIWIDLARDREGAVLWALRVKPAWRGRGLGRRLIAAAEHISRHHRRGWVEIEAEPNNLRARALYESLGYRWLRRGLAVDAITRAALDFELDTFRREVQQHVDRGRGREPALAGDVLHRRIRTDP